MCTYTDIQEKCASEIREKVGTKDITMDDRQALPYCEATIEELMRHIPMIVFGIQRATIKDFNIGGYVIPKVQQHILFHTT